MTLMTVNNHDEQGKDHRSQPPVAAALVGRNKTGAVLTDWFPVSGLAIPVDDQSG